MRLFIALELPLQVKDSLEKWRKQVSGEYPALKWTQYENLHVTLRFLGSVNPDSVITRMDGLNLRRFLPVHFELNRTGTFGKPPSVLWAGGRFSGDLKKAAELLGEIPDEKGNSALRNFVPHVTVARASRGQTIPEVPFTMNLEGEAEAISLFQSTLAPSGPVYRSLFSIGS